MKPEVSEKFTVEDIRKIREYNSLRHVKMSPKEIIEDTRKGAQPCFGCWRTGNCQKYRVSVLSG